MTDIAALIKRCRTLGATITPLENRLKVRAPEPLPDDIIAALRDAKAEVMAELRREVRENHECWVLEQWRTVSIPEWRRTLSESIEQRDKKREEYALWMLTEILEDPECPKGETK